MDFLSNLTSTFELYLIQKDGNNIGYYDEKTDEVFDSWDIEYTDTDRAEALAGFVNNLWDEYLTPEEQAEIRKILEG